MSRLFMKTNEQIQARSLEAIVETASPQFQQIGIIDNESNPLIYGNDGRVLLT